eukprot:1196161-Ditylum_brightwellii.AAC.1
MALRCRIAMAIGIVALFVLLAPADSSRSSRWRHSGAMADMAAGLWHPSGAYKGIFWLIVGY